MKFIVKSNESSVIKLNSVMKVHLGIWYCSQIGIQKTGHYFADGAAS